MNRAIYWDPALLTVQEKKMNKEEVIEVMFNSFNKKNKEMAELSGMSNEDIEKFIAESSVSIKMMLEQVYDDLLLNKIIAE
jgi:hypothetical protein